MDKKLIKLLVAIATDSRVLADYQRDPEATLAAFGLIGRGLKELIDLEARAANLASIRRLWRQQWG